MSATTVKGGTMGVGCGSLFPSRESTRFGASCRAGTCHDSRLTTHNCRIRRSSGSACTFKAASHVEGLFAMETPCPASNEKLTNNEDSFRHLAPRRGATHSNPFVCQVSLTALSSVPAVRPSVCAGRVGKQHLVRLGAWLSYPVCQE